MFCDNCGKQIKDNSKFCPYCGKTIEKDKSASRGADNEQKDLVENINEVLPAKKKSKKKWIIIFLVILVVGVCAGGVYQGFSILENKNGGAEKKAVVTEFFEKYQKMDESCGEYLLNNEEGVIKFKGAQALFAKSLEFDVKKIKRGDEYSVVNVAVNNVDMIKTIQQIIKDDPDASEDMTEKIIALLDSDDAPRKTFKVEVWVDNESNKIRMTGDLANALLGGYHEMINDLLVGGELYEEIN